MNLLDLRRARAAELHQAHEAAKAEARAIVDAVAAEARDMNDAERDAFAAAKAKVAAAKAAADQGDADVRELEATDLEARTAPKVTPVATVGGARVVSEERTYTPEAERRGVSFLRDVAARSLGDFDAAQRLSRHMNEVRVDRPELEARAIGTSAVASLVVPQYLTDLYAPKRRAGRPFADICAQHPLPAQGMTVEISRITTGSATAAQSSQNSAVQETNMDDTALSVAVNTLAGQQTVSRQALERGTNIEGIVLADLVSSLNTLVDSTLITTASTGLDAVTDANVDVAYTDASPTVAELWPKLADCIQQVQTAHYAGPSHIIMHPRRWAWLVSSVGTSFPFVQALPNAQGAGGTQTSVGYGSAIGNLMGLPVITDANISTALGAGTEDAIYVVNQDECHLWEDDVMYIRAEQTSAASLGVLFVVYKYMAYTFNRYPSANGRIAGTGLIAPTF